MKEAEAALELEEKRAQVVKDLEERSTLLTKHLVSWWVW